MACEIEVLCSGAVLQKGAFAWEMPHKETCEKGLHCEGDSGESEHL